MVYDIAAVHIAYFLALWGRFDFIFSRIPEEYLTPYKLSITVYSLVCVVVIWLFRLYKVIWRFVSYTELVRTFEASFLLSCLYTVGITAFIHRMPLTYYFWGALIQFIFLVSVRFSYRFYLLLKARYQPVNEETGRVMLIGGGAAGQMILRDINTSHETNDKVVCIIDDNPNKWTRYIDGVPVVGGRDDILSNVEKFRVNKIYLAIPSATVQNKRDILNICSETDCELKQLPGMYQFVLGQVSVSAMKNISIEDHNLLGADEMTNKSNTQTEVQQDGIIDILTFLQFLQKRMKLLIVGLLIGGLAGWALSTFVIAPKYTSFVDLYVTNNKKGDSDSVEFSDINAAQKLVSTYVVILQSNKVTQDVLTRLNSDMTSEQLLGMTTFTSVQNTEVLRINVVSEDPQLTKDICNSYMYTAQSALDSVVGAGSVKVISEPKLPDKPSSPSVPKFTLIGAFLGLMLMIGLSFISMRLNRDISDDKMLSERYSIPVLGTVPDFFQFSKALNISKKDLKKNQKLKAKNPDNEKIITSATILNDKTPFPIREAYNGIRSNILFSLANMKNGIILVTSPNANDLKTTTSINLAISMAHIGAKVLLVDCDLRNASIYRQFKLSNQKGISRVITGFESASDTTGTVEIKCSACAFPVLSKLKR